jgi:hypothetical protein
MNIQNLKEIIESFTYFLNVSTYHRVKNEGEFQQLGVFSFNWVL